MGVPCQLIYDRAKGGRVAEQILPRHPSSNGRSNSVPELPSAPAHCPQLIRPMNAKWVTAYSKWSDVSPTCIFRSWSDACHRLFSTYPSGLSVVVDGDEHSHLGWVSDAMRQGNLDGRDAVGIHYFDDLHGTYVTLRRCIMATDNSLTLQVSFTGAEWINGLKKPHPATFGEIASIVGLILAVDAERMFRRETESESKRNVEIQIFTDEISEQFGNRLEESIFNMLSCRVVAIEPQEDPDVVQIRIVRSG